MIISQENKIVREDYGGPALNLGKNKKS